MKILALDIGVGTQDILLFDSSETLENCVKLVLPSPTRIMAGKIRRATRRKRPLLLTGVNMGGGPSTMALRRHLEKGLAAYATPEAACTFDDDLEKVQSWGVKLVSPYEAQGLQGVRRIELRDVDLDALRQALALFDVPFKFDALGVAVLDHGAAPPDMSDRVFRFRHLEMLATIGGTLGSFVFLAPELPPYLTRMRSVVASVAPEIPALLMDTGAAAVMGALGDKEVARHPHRLIVNCGNAHTIAFHLEGQAILGLLEHHTHGLNAEHLDGLLEKLVAGTLTREEVYEEGGHGALVREKRDQMPFLAVTGPQGHVMVDSRLNPHYAAPHGELMLCGCFGLVRAFGTRRDDWQPEIERALGAG